MHLLDKYRLPLWQAPDPAGAAPTDPPAPAVDPPAPATTVDPPADPPAAPPSGWGPEVISTVTRLRGNVREVESENARLSRELAAAKEMLSRQTGAHPPAADPPAPAAPKFGPPTDITPPTSDADLDQRAAFKVLQRDIGTMRNDGLREFGAQTWNDTENALRAYGADSYDFIGSVLEADRPNAAKILRTIAEKPELALSLVGMTPVQRAAEIARLSMAAAPKKDDPPADPAKPPAAAAAPTKVSKAPPPPPPLTPSATKVVDWRSDEASDAEFSAGWEKNMRERFGSRRAG